MTFPYALIALGTNMAFADREGEALLRVALQTLGENGLPAQALSPFFRTTAWPDPSDPQFTNAVAILDARGFTAQGVLKRLLQIENMFGRVREKRNAPRTLDLDLLDYAGLVLNQPSFVLPHPRLEERAFVLEPLNSLWPEWRHPVTGARAEALFNRVSPGAAPAQGGAAD